VSGTASRNWESPSGRFELGVRQRRRQFQIDTAVSTELGFDRGNTDLSVAIDLCATRGFGPVNAEMTSQCSTILSLPSVSNKSVVSHSGSTIQPLVHVNKHVRPIFESANDSDIPIRVVCQERRKEGQEALYAGAVLRVAVPDVFLERGSGMSIADSLKVKTNRVIELGGHADPKKFTA
jgi:hypothetical protein